MAFFVRSLLLIALLAPSSSAWAKDFYVDPQNGAPSPTNDGSQAKPWRTLKEVVDAKLIETQNWEKLPYAAGAKLVPKNAGAPVKAGDTIWLLSGYHGDVAITGYYNSAPITIAAAPGQKPELAALLLRSSSHWVVRGLHVSPSYAPSYAKKTMIAIENHGHSGPSEEIIVEDCQLASVPDITAWTAADWNAKAANGISAAGTKITLRRNTLRNVNFGLSVSSSHSLVEHNVVDSFAGDGMRGLGDYTTFQYNRVQNCYDVNDNHDDGFQSWSVGADGKVGTGTVTGIVLRGNVIINYTDPNQPLKGPLQGIGCFDGTFVDWVVENNVIITDHWHGISLYGAKNVRVVNNTVLDVNNTTPGPPWIKITAHKNGTAPSGCVVRNNLATAFTSDKTGVTEDHNITIKDPALHFVDAAKFDVHLLATSTAIDAGDSQLAPTIDIEGRPRPQGAGFDVGAYEWSTDPLPADGGPAADGATAKDGAAAGDGAPPAQDAGAASDGLASGDAAVNSGDGAVSTARDSGCSCRLGDDPGSAGSTALLLLLCALALGCTRRRSR